MNRATYLALVTKPSEHHAKRRAKQKKGERTAKIGWLRSQKLKPCADCRKQYNPWVMQFDHNEPKDKLFNLSKCMRYSWDQIRLEVLKCTVRCSNCHIERTYQQRQAGLI